MKYLSHVVSFFLGGAVTAIGFLVISPPSTIDLGIEIGRKLGLAAAEKTLRRIRGGSRSPDGSG